MQGTIRDKLINTYFMFLRNAVSNQWHKVFVMDTANDLNLLP